MKVLLAICAALCVTSPVMGQRPANVASDSRPRSLSVVEPPVARSASQIHLVLVGDTYDPKIGQSAAVDLRNLADLFRELVPAWQLETRVLDGDSVSKESILRTIGALRPSADDALVFIFTGHGAYDDFGHFFGMRDGDRLYRADVVTALRLLRTRLVVVLSGSCNENSQAPVECDYRAPDSVGPRSGNRPGAISPIAEELLLKPRGVVDINGASEGQRAVADPERGCAFLSPLSKYLRDNSTRRVSWQTLVDEISPRVQEFVNNVRPIGYTEDASQRLETRQTPRVWALPDDGRGTRLGIGAATHNGNGVRVVEVLSNFPGTRLVCMTTGQRVALEPGDVILTINGQKIESLQDYDRAVRRSPRQIMVAVQNWRDGRVGLLATTLQY
jgi:Caspase domain